MEPHPLDHQGRHRSQDGRAPCHQVPPHNERRLHAGPVKEHLSGRNRLRLRDNRLLPLQRTLRIKDLRHAAQERRRQHQPDRIPSARGLCARSNPVQLHLHSFQPLHDARPYGQRGNLEAFGHRHPLQLLPHAAVQGGRPAGRRGKLPSRQRRPHRQGGNAVKVVLRNPLHRLHRNLQQPVAPGG